MPTITKRELRRMVETSGAKETVQHLTRAMRKGWIKPDELSIRDIAESVVTDRRGNPVGQSWVKSLGPQRSARFDLVESSSAVMLSNFSDITGQIFYNKLMEDYEKATLVSDQLVETMPTDLDGEKIAGIAEMAEDLKVIHESMPYPEIGLSPDYIETPKTEKRGAILSLTKETIFFDRTNQILKKAARIGELMGRNKEKRILDVVLGFTNNYKWNGTTYNTYLTSGNWINSKTGQALTDWTSIDVVEQMFANILEPNSSEPININARQILHTPAQRHEFRQILKATTLETLSDSGNQRRFGPNTLDPYSLIESKYMYRRLIANSVSAANAAETWIVGDFKKAFAYAENWGVQVTKAPINSEPEFKQDIVARFKVSERGVAFVQNPRYAVKVVNGT